jgi:hypothetical protein
MIPVFAKKVNQSVPNRPNNVADSLGNTVNLKALVINQCYLTGAWHRRAMKSVAKI